MCDPKESLARTENLGQVGCPRKSASSGIKGFAHPQTQDSGGQPTGFEGPCRTLVPMPTGNNVPIAIIPSLPQENAELEINAE